MEDLYDDLSGQVDEIDQDLADVETELFDDDLEPFHVIWWDSISSPE